jgi:hypothetical protein
MSDRRFIEGVLPGLLIVTYIISQVFHHETPRYRYMERQDALPGFGPWWGVAV